MNQATLDAFEDELSKIGEREASLLGTPSLVAYELRKEASWLTGLGTLAGRGKALASGAVSAARGAQAVQGVTRVVPGDSIRGNLINTAAGFTRPLSAMGEGWRSGKWRMVNEMYPGGHPGSSAPWYSKAGYHASRALPGSKAMTIGSTAMMVPEAVSKEDPTGKGRSRTERVGRAAGNLAGGLIGAPHGMSGGIAGSIVGEQLGSLPGRLLKRKKPKTPKPDIEPKAPSAQPQSVQET